MTNEKKKNENEAEETLLEFLSRSGLGAILPFLERPDDPPRHVDLWFEEDDCLVDEEPPKGT